MPGRLLGSSPSPGKGLGGRDGLQVCPDPQASVLFYAMWVTVAGGKAASGLWDTTGTVPIPAQPRLHLVGEPHVLACHSVKATVAKHLFCRLRGQGNKRGQAGLGSGHWVGCPGFRSSGLPNTIHFNPFPYSSERAREVKTFPKARYKCELRKSWVEFEPPEFEPQRCCNILLKK